MQFRAEEQMLADVCGRIAHEMGDGTTTENLLRFRAFLHMLASGDQRPSSTYMKPAFWGALLVTFVLGLAIFIYYPKEVGFKFRIGHDEAIVSSGQRVFAMDREVSISFEQGSNFSIRKGSVAEVVENNQDLVRFNLEQGEVGARVVGNNRTKWSVAAGPFNVVVVGTKFSVSWDKTEGDLDVNVEEGTVLVEGARYAEQGIEVSQGYRLRMNERTNAFALQTGNDSSNQSSVGPAQSRQLTIHMSGGPILKLAPAPTQYLNFAAFDNPLEGPISTPGPRRKYRPDANKSRKAPATGVTDAQSDDNTLFDLSINRESPLDTFDEERSTSQWLQFYEQGDYAAAVKAAESIGISSLIEVLDLEKLWKLMHAARNEGRTHIAENALTACRQRFPWSKKANIAAFILGKISYENKQDMDAAVRWFSTYLRESPQGQLAEEAEGRIMTALATLGKRNDAQRTAEEYLRKYPRGVFSRAAELLTGR